MEETDLVLLQMQRCHSHHYITCAQLQLRDTAVLSDYDKIYS